MRVADLRIGARLGTAFAVLLLMLVGVGGFGVVSMGRTQARLDHLVTHNEVQIAHATTMASGFRDIMMAVSLMVQAQDKAGVDDAKKRVGAARARYGAAKKEFTAGLSTDQEKALIERLDTALKAAVPTSNKVSALIDAGDGKGASEAFLKENEPAGRGLIQITDDIVRYEQESSREAAAASRAEYETARALVIGACALTVLLGAVVAWLSTLSITRPLARAVGVAETVATGDLTLRIAADTRDEAGRLMGALATMTDSLADVAGAVNGGARAMADAVSQIAAGNQDLSQRTEEQASSLEETAAAMEELTGTVKQNADNARHANQLAISAADVAVQAGQVVGEVIETMGAIQDASRQVAEIIGVIDGIAFQTNILALNAAVEAARAGEQGRGFAVVATEVRSLAQRSATAAKQIKGLIDDSVAKVDAGTRLVGRAGETMDSAVGSIKRVTGIMGEIAAASQEQTRGIDQVNQAITQMDQVTQQNAALVEEAAAAAQSLREQASALVEAVSVFRIDPGREPARATAGGAPVSLALPHAAPRRANAAAASVHLAQF